MTSINIKANKQLLTRGHKRLITKTLDFFDFEKLTKKGPISGIDSLLILQKYDFFFNKP